MPDNQEQSEEKAEIDTAGDNNSELPTMHPPKTKAPVSFNQQNNFYQQIPSNAWGRLSSVEIVELSKKILDHANMIDERHFEYAKKRLENSDRTHKRNIFLGSVVTVIGIAATAYLAMHGHEVIAMTVSLPLSTIIAMLLGNRLLS